MPSSSPVGYAHPVLEGVSTVALRSDGNGSLERFSERAESTKRTNVATSKATTNISINSLQGANPTGPVERLRCIEIRRVGHALLDLARELRSLFGARRTVILGIPDL